MENIVIFYDLYTDDIFNDGKPPLKYRDTITVCDGGVAHRWHYYCVRGTQRH